MELTQILMALLTLYGNNTLTMRAWRKMLSRQWSHPNPSHGSANIIKKKKKKQQKAPNKFFRVRVLPGLQRYRTQTDLVMKEETTPGLTDRKTGPKGGPPLSS